MRILVTGGAGFIGSAIVDRAVDRGHEVVVLDALLPTAHRGVPAYCNPGAEYVWAGLADRPALERCLRGVQAVSHQAAMVGLGLDFSDTPAYVANNDLGTAELLGALAASGFAGRLVLAGSMVVYGEGRYRCPAHGLVRPGPRPLARLRAGRFEPECPRCGLDLVPEAVPEGEAPDPRNVYAATKAHQEQLCACLSRERGVPLTVLRYHNVYGPRMPAGSPYAGVAAIFRSAAAGGLPIRVFEDGGQLRDFVHVDDVATANLLALEDPCRENLVCNIASGRPASVLAMATALLAATSGAGAAPLVTGEFRLGDVRHVFACTDRASRALGFRAGVGLEEGMARFATAAGGALR